MLRADFNASALGELAAGQDYDALADNSVEFAGCRRLRRGSARCSAFVSKCGRVYIPCVTFG